jgi:glycosyltransferase involved in cell wall biosynthesis
VLDSIVLFNDGWVPYAERANWLLDAACAISTHRDHLETRFAFRTRVLDCFWSGLPVICTAGDDLSDRIERDDLGAAVPPESPDATADALERVLERGRDSYASALAVAAKAHGWSRVAEPIARWIADRSPASPRPRRRGRVVAKRLRAVAYAAGRRALPRSADS